MTEIKTCSCKKCNKSFLLTKEFFYMTKGKFKTSKCKACKRAATAKYQKDNKDKINAYQKAYKIEYFKDPVKLERAKKNRKRRYRINKAKKLLAKATNIQEINKINEELNKYLELIR